MASGLKWLIRQQMPDGSWTLDDRCSPTGGPRRTTSPAPRSACCRFLAAGNTHKPAKDNPYDKPIDKALDFLNTHQDKDGYFGGEHVLPTAWPPSPCARPTA